MDLKKLGYFLSPVLLFSVLTASGFAGGYEWGGFGGRSGALGGAFIGLADDWTANYWNPAGLAQLEGKAVGVDLLSPHPTMRATNSFANLPYSPQTEESYRYTHDMFIDYTSTFTGGMASEPNRFSQTKTSDDFYHPNGSGGYITLPEFTLGAAVYSPLGYYSDWEDTIPQGRGTISAENFERLIIVECQLSLAREIIPDLYAGAGLGILYDRIDRESEKIVSDSGILDYTYDFDIENDGFGAEGSFGLLYKLSDYVSVGAVYRTGASVTLKGKAESSLSLRGWDESTRVKQKFRHPPTWGIGIAVKPIPDLLTLTADWQRTEWSFWRTNVEFDQEGNLLNSENYDEDWNDSNRYRFGCEYMVKPDWAARAGFMYDESPLPDKSVSLAYIPDVDRKAISLGGGFKPDENWEIDALGAWAWGERNARGAKFEQRVWAISAGATYKF